MSKASSPVPTVYNLPLTTDLTKRGAPVYIGFKFCLAFLLGCRRKDRNSACIAASSGFNIALCDNYCVSV